MKTLGRIFAATVAVMVATAMIAPVGYPSLFTPQDGHEAVVKIASEYLTNTNASTTSNRSFMALLAGEF